ncbi:MAG TPA: DUF4265 domain-containing protein [Tepidisphaeraceae bacterium]
MSNINTPLHHVNLLMDYVEGKPLYESVPALKISENRYKILASPGFAPGVAKGDEIELSSIEKAGYRILRRSGNLAVQLFLRRCSPEERKRIVNVVQNIGGELDGGKDGEAGHLLIFTISVSAGFDVIESTMQRIAEHYPVDRWMYGNVYDTKDGVTPLNWWL